MSAAYEFINPSDAIQFDASSDEVAALAALVVGRGQCSARRIDAPNHELVVGFAMFGGDGGFRECYGRSIADGLTALAGEVEQACRSFRLTKGERTSANNWCEYAHGLRLQKVQP
ncbi:MAG: hypothetical protein K2Y26_00030 [Gemmatimonadaceae bacterium]|nr:hypothetical protein [Gemmatimonadaceae bacterium]